MRGAICGAVLAAVWVVGGSPALPADRRVKESEAAEALYLAGATLNQHLYKPGDAVWSVAFLGPVSSRPAVTDQDLAALEHLPKLRLLHLAYTKVSDRGLDHVKGRKRLEELDLWHTPVTDAGLERLKELSNLSSLSLGQTRITDAGVVHLKNLVKLRELKLVETSITDAGLVNLQKLNRLESLELTRTLITDAGLKHLQGLRQLQKVELVGTKVTNEGVAELKKALPNVSIRHKVEPAPKWLGRPPVPYPLIRPSGKWGPFPP